MWNGRLKRHYRTTRPVASVSMCAQASCLDASGFVPLGRRIGEVNSIELSEARRMTTLPIKIVLPDFESNNVNRFTAKMASLKSASIRERFGAVQDLCLKARGLTFLQRQELIVWPVLEMLVDEGDDDVLEASLWRLADVLTASPADVVSILEICAGNDALAQFGLAIVSRCEHFNRTGAVLCFEQSSTGYYLEPAALELIANMVTSPSPAIRLSAQAILIQASPEPFSELSQAQFLPELSLENLRTVRDPLMRRRIVALSPLHPNYLPELTTLGDPDGYVALRAVAVLLKAGRAGEAVLMAALQSDEPTIVARTLEGLRENTKLAEELLRRNAAIGRYIVHWMKVDSPYNREPAVLCAVALIEALLEVCPDAQREMIARAKARFSRWE